jgi:hypothetical protein
MYFIPIYFFLVKKKNYYDGVTDVTITNYHVTYLIIIS